MSLVLSCPTFSPLGSLLNHAYHLGLSRPRSKHSRQVCLIKYSLSQLKTNNEAAAAPVVPTCWNCGKIGHRKLDCDLPKGRGKGKGKPKVCVHSVRV